MNILHEIRELLVECAPLPAALTRERCQSGRMYRTRNPVWRYASPWVRIPPSPPNPKGYPHGCPFCICDVGAWTKLLGFDQRASLAQDARWAVTSATRDEAFAEATRKMSNPTLSPNPKRTSAKMFFFLSSFKVSIENRLRQLGNTHTILPSKWRQCPSVPNGYAHIFG